jgi:GNAT superfamily N-acetyltransferase
MTSVPVTLRDGAEIVVRPVAARDGDLLRAGFERLSPQSRYRRFLTAMPELSPSAVAYLTDVDHRDHEALVALDAAGRGVGVARYVRESADPRAAEAAVTVVDDWQGRGVGSLLLRVLADRAREEGVATFTALLLAQNDDMLGLFERLGPVRTVDREPGVVAIEVSLPETGVGEPLSELLRGTASGRLEARQSARLRAEGAPLSEGS